MMRATTPILVRAGWLTLVTIGACIRARTLARAGQVPLPDVAVVRRWITMSTLRRPTSNCSRGCRCRPCSVGPRDGSPRIMGRDGIVFWVGFLQNILRPLQVTGRKMNLALFASRLWFDSALVEATSAVVPVLAHVIASTHQALQEGGVYFSFYFYDWWARGGWPAASGVRAAAAVIILPIAAAAFRAYAYANGCRSQSSTVQLPRETRFMLSTTGFRLPQLAASSSYSQRRARATWLPLAAVQLPFFLYYFFMLRAMGRSYVESASTDGTIRSDTRPLVADVASNVFRACEPLLGGGLVTLLR